MCLLFYVVPLKRCCHCSLLQPWENFHARRNVPDGMEYRCRHCDSLKQRTHYQKNKDHKIAYGRAWKKSHRAKILQQRRQRYAANPERYRAAARMQYHKNPVQGVLYAQNYRIKNRAIYLRTQANSNARLKPKRKAWRHMNKMTLVRYTARRKALKKGLPDTFSQEEQKFMHQYWGYACAVCGNQQGFLWGLAEDHWIPLASPLCPGTIATNMIPLCHGNGGCNNSKHIRDPHEWLHEHFPPAQAKRILKAAETYFALVRARSKPAAAD